ncbi:hypothetical protein LINGRAPRIM_LOCUS3437 [Linum grandiflorum]
MSSRLIACPYLGPIHQGATSNRRLANDFSKRDIMKMIVPHIDRFVKYGSLCPYRYILSLGWSSFLHTFCRTAVQKFYCNLAVISVQHLQAQTVVDGRVILFNPGVTNQLVVIPIEGIPYCSELEIHSQGFDFEVAGAALCSSPPDRLTHFNISFLLEDLRVLHWFVTWIFLPRSFAWDTVTPIDVWVLHNAFYGQPLSLPHLLFTALLDVGASFYPGSLPFAPQLTLLMHTVGIDLSDNILKHAVYHLNPQHILRRVHCAAAPVKPPPAAGGEEEQVSSFINFLGSRRRNDGHCCDAHELIGKLDGFIEALANKTGNSSSIAPISLRARCVMERAKIKLSVQLQEKIVEVARKLEERMD